MAMTIDSRTEERIQRLIDSGAFPSHDEVLSRLLEMLEAEESLLRNKDAISAHIEEGFAQSERGETYSPEEARAILAERRMARTAG